MKRNKELQIIVYLTVMENLISLKATNNYNDNKKIIVSICISKVTFPSVTGKFRPKLINKIDP
jgi:hypothetical protein